MLGLAGLAACGFPRPPDVPDCTSSADCKSPGAPFCQTSTGTCVGCLDGASCPADKPVCDASARVCRGCDRDDECPSGVCLEAEGRCAAEVDVVFVSANSSDVGGCSKAAPCGTLSYALSKITTNRNVIALTAGQVFAMSTIAFDRSVYVHANGTLIHSNGVVASVAPVTAVTLANLSLTADSGTPLVAATVSSAGSLRLFRTGVTGQITTNGGAISATKSTFITPTTFNADGITCTSGTVAVSGSVFQRVQVVGSNCQVTIEKSRFDMLNDGSIHVQGGFARIENNVIMNANDLADSMYVTAATPGSTVRFNTFVNTSGIPSDGIALYCDGTPLVTSNIFAYNSMHPFSPTDTCPTRYSLFDSTASSEETVGAGNQSSDPTRFFIDRTQKDFHLGPDSPARGKAEPCLGVADDFDGHPRPTAADVGAYQHL